MEEKIYPHSFEHAVAHDETRAYHASIQRNVECAAAIDEAIVASNYEQYHYNLSDALNTVVKDFDLDRVAWVVAAAVQHYNNDGRLSHTNKDWAQGFPIPDARDGRFLPRTHLAVFDGFVNEVRKARLHELAQTVGAYEKRHHMADRNRLTDYHPDKDVFVPKRGVTEQRLTERRDEITEKQSVMAQLRAARKAEKPAQEHGKNRHEAER